jgi:arsenate reductase-like glutaredoxin family protein
MQLPCELGLPKNAKQQQALRSPVVDKPEGNSVGRNPEEIQKQS